MSHSQRWEWYRPQEFATPGDQLNGRSKPTTDRHLVAYRVRLANEAARLEPSRSTKPGSFLSGAQPLPGPGHLAKLFATLSVLLVAVFTFPILVPLSLAVPFGLSMQTQGVYGVRGTYVPNQYGSRPSSLDAVRRL